MKKLLLLLSITFVYADVNWLNSYEAAQQTKKPIFIYISHKGCPACDYMDKTLKDKQIYSYLNQHFASIKKDVYDSSIKLPSHLKASGTPTLHFIGKDGKKLIESHKGAKGAKGFYQMLQSATK